MSPYIMVDMFGLPDLLYSFDALEPHIDKDTMEIHYNRHHAAYIKNLNDALVGHDDLLNMEIDDLISNLDLVPDDLRTKVRNNGGGHANHSMFWAILAPADNSQPGENLLTAINKSFGSLDNFKIAFTKVALGRFGSGWAWLIVNNNKLEVVDTLNQDSPLMNKKHPILGLDVWEHAYYLKHQNRRAEYIEAFWNVVNWDVVSNRFDQAQGS